MTAVPDVPAPLRRFAALGDLHAEDERLALVLAWLSDQSVDAALAVGDLADGHGDLDRTCALLRRHRVVAVRGNHDRWLLADELRDLRLAHRRDDLTPPALAFLAGLPPTRRLATCRGDLLLCHGVGDDDMVRLRPRTDGYALAVMDPLHRLLADPALRLLVAGHTHERMVRSFARPAGPPLVVVNPGTLHRDYVPGLAIVDLERATVEFHDIVEAPSGRLDILAAEVAPLPA